MMETNLKTLSDWAGGALIQGTPETLACGIATDSRSIPEGSLFVALKGDRFDAHNFLGDVVEQDPAAILVSALPKETESYMGGVIFVRDTLRALQDIARQHRTVCADLSVIGITGSNGKTSTKDFLGAVLSRAGRVSKTAGNFNNHIGVPLTVLSTAADARFGVWEMGMNHEGEIEVLAEIAAPDAAVITNVGTAHIEHLKTREAIAEEKSQLPRAISGDGYCAMPSSDDFYEYIAGAVSCEMIPTGGSAGVVRAEKVEVLAEGGSRFHLVSDFGSGAEVSLPVRGSHMIENSLLAAAVGLKEGLSSGEIAEALSQVQLTSGRLEEKQVRGISVLDDSYNANPDSMRAAVRVLNESNVSGRRVAVLGFMGELGDFEDSAHRELGGFAAESGIDALITVGDRAVLINEGAEGIVVSENFDSHGEAAGFLRDYLADGDLVLFKGSRAADMGKVLEGIESE